VGMIIRPEDIHVMHKECLRNSFKASFAGGNNVNFLGEDWEVDTAAGNNAEILAGLSEGDEVWADVEFRDVELMDEKDEGNISGQVSFILYKGNHYFLTIKTEGGDKLYVQTDDVWDKSDLVGIKIMPKNIRLRKIGLGAEGTENA
jgi:spermidine/putrescine transport system ATP-binding protein